MDLKKQSRNKIQNALHNVIHDNSTNTQSKMGVKKHRNETLSISDCVRQVKLCIECKLGVH